jgi:hypothetical protein
VQNIYTITIEVNLWYYKIIEEHKNKPSYIISIILQILSLLNLRRICGVIKKLVDKRKLRYYKEVVIPNLEDQNYIVKLGVRSQVKNMDLPNLLSHQNYGDLRRLLSMFIEHRNTIVKKLK